MNENLPDFSTKVDIPLLKLRPESKERISPINICILIFTDVLNESYLWHDDMRISNTIRSAIGSSQCVNTYRFVCLT